MIPLRVQAAGSDRTASLRRVDEVLDARLMAPRLRSALDAAGSAACHVLDAKYEPGVRCTVLYRVGDRLVRGDLLDDGDGVAPSRPVVAPGLQLSAFPDDPDLPHLADAADPARLRDALRVVPGAGPALRCRVDLLRYRPGKRATLAVDVRERPGTRARRLVAKSYHDGRKAAAVAAEARLLDAAADPAGPLRLAPVRAHLPDLSLVVQERVAGRPLDELLRTTGPAGEDALHRAAAALAALHALPAVSRRIRAVDAEVARFAVRAGRVAEVDAGTGAALADLAGRLAATARDVPPGVPGLVHGDCKPSQFLLRGARDVVLLDLDSCGTADPAADVGTFVATLRQHLLRDLLARRAAPADLAARSALPELFLRSYATAAGSSVDGDLRRRVTWYEAVALERKALRCFARAPRSPLTRVLVADGHACLDRLGGTR